MSNINLEPRPWMVNRMLSYSATQSHLPEGRLFLAIIACAVRDLAEAAYGQSALVFMSSKHFDEVCTHCGLDPEFARKVISGADLKVPNKQKPAKVARHGR